MPLPDLDEKVRGRGRLVRLRIPVDLKPFGSGDYILEGRTWVLWAYGK